jgi:D-tyrosyl-tRNA(Tyr) deacylase
MNLAVCPSDLGNNVAKYKFKETDNHFFYQAKSCSSIIYMDITVNAKQLKQMKRQLVVTAFKRRR